MADTYRTRDGRVVNLTPFALAPDGKPRGKHYVEPRGYAAPPGTGPADKECRDCAHYTHRDGVAGSYPKCAANRRKWTGGRATDILAKSPACRLFLTPTNAGGDDGR